MSQARGGLAQFFEVFRGFYDALRTVPSRLHETIHAFGVDDSRVARRRLTCKDTLAESSLPADLKPAGIFFGPVFSNRFYSFICLSLDWM
jgi:hypothetical protein